MRAFFLNISHLQCIHSIAYEGNPVYNMSMKTMKLNLYTNTENTKWALSSQRVMKLVAQTKIEGCSRLY